MDPLKGTPWSAADTVAGFARAQPNAALVRFAAGELDRATSRRALDLGCGAGRNAVPLASLGWRVFGVDLSQPMIEAAAGRRSEIAGAGRLDVALASMDALPAPSTAFDLVVAHGIWNLARSGAEFRAAVAEAARVARDEAALFVFTFSRNTLPAEAAPVAGEAFVFTQFSGQPQVFLTEAQLVAELGAAGFAIVADVPIVEHNRRERSALLTPTAPVIYEAIFRRRAR